MIQVRQVWKKTSKRRKGSQWILEDANFVVPKGRRVALLNTVPEDNKSLLRMFCGLVQPDEGIILREGLFSLPLAEATFLDFRATFGQNVNYLSLLYGYDAKAIGELALHFSRVAIKPGKPLLQLTGADRIRLSLGFVLAIPYDWYFVNEAIPKVPPDMVDVIEYAFAERFSRGSVIWAAAKPEFLTGYCDSGIVIDQGRATFHDDIDEACAVYQDAMKSSAGKK